jgi:hypothetical protein
MARKKVIKMSVGHKLAILMHNEWARASCVDDDILAIYLCVKMEQREIKYGEKER